MKASVIIAIVLGLVCVGLGAAVISTVYQNRELAAQLDDAQAKPSASANAPDADRLRRLLEQEQSANTELRDELAKLKRAATNSPPAVKPVAVDQTSQRPPPLGPGGNAWLERIRQEDPARYKQIVEQREQRRKAADQWFQDTISQQDQRAASAPTQPESELATQIADTLAKLNDLRQQWAALRELPQEDQSVQAQQLATQTREIETQLRDLSQQDRSLQLQNYANSLGITDQNGQQNFAQGISNIYSNTSFRNIRGGGGPGFGGPGGPPPAASSTPPAPTP